MPDSKFILTEFEKALRKKIGPDVVNLDLEYNYQFDFSINRLEEVFKVMEWKISPIKWSYYRIGFLKQGQGSMIEGIHKFEAKKNILVVTAPRVVTTSKNWSHDAKGYILMFNLNFFLQNNFPHKYIENRRILNTSIKPYIFVTDEQAEQLTNIFETIITENESTKNDKNEFIALKIIELLIISERLFAQEQNLEANLPAIDIIKRFFDLMETHFLVEHSVSFYAAKLNVHPNYLNAMVKKITGITAKESIQNRLLMETKYLLHSTNLSIKEISSQLGFHDPNYFGVFFKKSENISPVNYRASFI